MWRGTNIILRLAAVLVLLAASMFIPWWATMVLVAMNGLVFRLFLEGVLIGWFIDVSFATSSVPWITISILVYVAVVEAVVYYISH